MKFWEMIADAHRDDGRRFVVRAEDMSAAFLELEEVLRAQPAPGVPERELYQRRG